MKFDFSKNQSINALDAVPADFRGLYVEHEGGFKLDDSDSVKSAVAAITALNNSLGAARTELDSAKAKAIDLSPLADFGGTPEEIKQSINTKIEEMQQQLAGSEDAKVNLEKIKQDLAAGYEVKIQKAQERNKALMNQLENLLVTNAAMTAISEAKGDVDLLLPFVQRAIKTVEEDGQFKVLVVDDAGDRRYSGTTGTQLSIKELVEEMKGNDKYSKLFQSEAPSGGGKSPAPHFGSPNVGKKELTSVEKIAAGLSKGQYSTKLKAG